MPTNLEVGSRGEAVAAQFLASRKYRILHANLHLGRLGELDIVARDGKCLVLVEVKSKIAGQWLGGMENVTAAKQRKLRDLGAMYLQRYGGDHNSVRFDVIEIEFADASLSRHVVRHVPDAFRG